MPQKVLVTGASIAGNALALSLGRSGFDVTVVERASAFRDGGQNVDVRGVGRGVMRRMGLEQAALDHGTGEEGTAWVRADGTIVARFLAAGTARDGPTAEMEILRGDLARLFYAEARRHAAYRFGDRVASIVQDGQGVSVTFAGGATERYDAVVIAEGVGSTTRALAFPGESDSRWMDLTIAYFTIPRTPDDDRLWRWYHAPGGRSVSLRPDRHGTTRAMLSIRKPPGGEQDWGVGRQKAWLRERFADAGWQAPRVLAGMEATGDFYLDVLRQVRMPRWFDRRVALTGDAAWCVTPIGGVGTTLAVTGAYVLAAELARAVDPATAFAAYERAMRPMAEDAQGVPAIAPRLANPASRIGIRALHGALALASRPAVRRVGAALSARGTPVPDLSAYDAPGGGDRLSTRPERGALPPLAALGVVGAVLGASALVGRRNAPDPSHPGIRRWYRRLDKPGFTPPDAAFAAVWPALAAGLAFGGYRLLRRPSGAARNAAAGLLLANAAMTGGWTELFFRKRRLGASVAASGAMVVTGAAYVAAAARSDRPAAAAGVPFVAWLGCATRLAGRIRRDNPAERGMT